MTMQAMSMRGSTNPTLHRRGDRMGVARMGSAELEVEEGSRSVAINRQERQSEERCEAGGRKLAHVDGHHDTPSASNVLHRARKSPERAAPNITETH